MCRIKVIFVSEEHLIQGNGGPLIVLQSSAVRRWNGAKNFENSVMNGGWIETDYDVICWAEEVSVIHRKERDMLVLSACEWPGSIRTLSSGEILIVQIFGSDLKSEELAQRARERPPIQIFPFRLVDKALILMVGANAGNNRHYGFSKVSISPGAKLCEIYACEDANIAVIRDRTG